MVWLVVAVAIVLVVLTVAAVLGRVDGALADPTTTMSHVPLPEDSLTPADLDGVRFDTAMRGYRMSQVDATLDRLRRELADLQQRAGVVGEQAPVGGQDAVPVLGADAGPPEPAEDDVPAPVAPVSPALDEPSVAREPS